MSVDDFTSVIRDTINPEIKNTALILGNGINNFCDRNNSWNNLLIDLARKNVSKKADYKKILEDKSVSYPEFFDLVDLSREPPSINLELKKRLAAGISRWKPQKAHNMWVSKFMEIDRPILTTNFDYLLELSDNRIESYIKSKSQDKRFSPLNFKIPQAKREFTTFYPWRSYYSDRIIRDCNREFAIWHIHGFCDYVRSIRMGLSDYMGIVEKSRKLLYKSSGNPFKDFTSMNNWIGKNTWLDVFLNNNLLIVGLGLEVQEVSLRWLLIIREKLFKKYEERGIRKKTWFILNEEYDSMLEGKKLFFEKLNIEIIYAKKSEYIYDILPTII
ncbi:MAG: SIR2 family protein [Candidatus Lokiarchaeota archaeon]|nr:SIR2 family protein [Candidatus Lokiarchaeota archaeon]